MAHPPRLWEPDSNMLIKVRQMARKGMKADEIYDILKPPVVIQVFLRMCKRYEIKVTATRRAHNGTSKLSISPGGNTRIKEARNAAGSVD